MNICKKINNFVIADDIFSVKFDHHIILYEELRKTSDYFNVHTNILNNWILAPVFSYDENEEPGIPARYYHNNTLSSIIRIYLIRICLYKIKVMTYIIKPEIVEKHFDKIWNQL